MLLYIDPGTGSMLVTIIIGLFGTGLYFLRNMLIKVRYMGKKEKISNEKLPVVIFSDSKVYWNVFEPICDELEKRGQQAVYMTMSEDDPALEKKYEHVETKFIGSGNTAYASLNSLNASVVLSSTPSLDVFQWKRSKNADFYIHILHAPGDISMYRMFGIDYYDAFLLSGEFQGEQVRKLEELRNLPEREIVYSGLTYMDTLHDKYVAIQKKGKTQNDKEKTILLAPSWGPNGILKKYGAGFIEKLIATGYNLVIRPHPQSYVSEAEYMEELKNKFPETDKLKWNRDTDNFEVLMNSDIMISDFSGVIFDYAMVFDKPLIYTTPDYDKAIYDCAWIDDELWTFDILPEIGVELSEDKFDDIGAIIKSSIDSDKMAEGRERARREAWMNSGHAAEKSVEYILEKLEELNAKEIEDENLTDKNDEDSDEVSFESGQNALKDTKDNEETEETSEVEKEDE